MKKEVVPEAINPISGSISYILDLTQMAKKNRHNSTLAEDIIWQQILRYKKTGFKFSRQKPINRFILDFYCSELNLAIEIDGSSHIKKHGTDILRDKFLSQIGTQTIRFTNEEILHNFREVKYKVQKTCSSLSCLPAYGGSRGGTPTYVGGKGLK